MKSFSYGALICIACTAASCGFTQKIRTGHEAFEVKQYALAVQFFTREYEEDANPELRPEIAFLTGQSYEYMRMPGEASIWYRRAYDQDFGIAALERYAETLRQTERYEEAIEAYRELIALGSDELLYRSRITLCTQAIQWKQEEQASPYRIRPVDFNSPSSDYAPYVIGPDLVVFSSDRQSGGNQGIYQWTGRSFSNLYVADLETGLVRTFDPVANSPANEGTVTFSADRNEMYFTRCYPGAEYDSYCRIMASYRRGNTWLEPVPLPFQKEGVNYGHPALALGDSVLIFSSDDPDEGPGGYDLYYTQRTAQGWSAPVLFSERINTPGNERFPFMYRDTLYFSSDHHPGFGGLDIFKTWMTATGEWAPPQNLRAPINSGYDDFAFVVDTFYSPRGDIVERGYFSSSRNPRGADDIYLYEKLKSGAVVVPEVIAEKEEPRDKTRYQVFVAIRTVQPVFEVPDDPNSPRIGKAPLPAASILVGSGQEVDQRSTGRDALLIMEVEWDRDYLLMAQHRGFLNREHVFSTKNITKNPDNPVHTYNIEIMLEPIFVDREIIMADIYYDLDKWDIRDDAIPALNRLATLLKENPEIRIQLSSHTDCRASEEYNLDLSQKRAQSAVDFLVAAGIDAGRMVAVGFGESTPAIDCICEQCTEAQHQANRRTTFKILGEQ